MITAMPRIAIAVHEFESAVKVFRDEFGMPVTDFSDQTVSTLGAHVAMCQPLGGSNIELMAPANPAKPLSQALQKFLNRRGDGIYALMLEAADPDAEAEVLLGRNLKVLPKMLGAGGRDIHPSSTHGVLIRVYPENSVSRPNDLVSASPNYSGITKVVIATNDASVAADAYSVGLGLSADKPRLDAERGLLSVLVHPPEGGVIDLVSPVDLSRPTAQNVANFLNAKGEGIYALQLSAEGDVGEVDRLVFGARILISN
ncbi:MAG: VOC family protein [Actinomycetota bacterium]